MSGQTKIRININPQALIKLASLVSNSLLLSANVVLLTHDVRHRIQEKRSEVITNRLQMTAEVASAIVGLAKVIVNVLDER